MEIRENDATVTIDGQDIDGFIAEERPCQFCNETPSIYFDLYDTYACPRCNLWLEEACSDPGCDCCSVRPTVPFGRGANPV
jgi:hypothetical protein